MLDKLLNLFKDNKKKNENLIFLLIVLVITMFLINRIMLDNNKTIKKESDNNKELVNCKNFENTLEERLENILGKINGVGMVSVLITYSESGSILPLYNETFSTNKIEEGNEAGTTKTTESNESKKEIIVDSASNPITQKTINPKIEGAIITAQGASDSKIKENIISAVEAATGLATHKIQVFEMK